MAIVGIGFGQHVHVPAFRADPRSRVAAICASTEERARKVADRLEIERAFGSWREVCACPDIDAVSISVPAALQPEIVQLAAQHGKHVFCEKPLATTEEGARSALESAVSAGIVHAMDFEFRAIPHWRRAREICRSGVLGRLRQIAVTWRVETMAYRDGRQSWKTSAPDGGGTLNLFGSHVLDYVEWIFGRVSRVACRMEPRTGARGDARVDAWLELESGAPVVASIAADAFCGPGHRIDVYGDEGTLILENPTNDYASGFRLSQATRATGRLEEVMGASRGDTDGRVLAVGAVVNGFIDRILGVGDSAVSELPTLVDGLRSQELAGRLLRSNASGSWQT